MNFRSEVFFFLHRLLGSNLKSIYKEFIEIQSWPQEYLEKLTKERLNSILHYAVSNIPFYMERVSADGISLDKFPILKKQDIIENYERIMHPQIYNEYFGNRRKKLYSWLEVKTGGSTGMPIRVIHDKQFREYGRAARLFANYMCGFPLGTPYLMLWGSMKDINQMKGSYSTRLMNNFLNFKLMNAFRLDEISILRYIEVINNTRSSHLMAYVDAVFQIAEFVKSRNIKVRKLDSIMGCAGTITNNMRKSIEDVFQCKLHNKYGSRDCGDMACECTQGGIHIFNNYILLEVVDEYGIRLPEGKSGRILVTSLMNYGFPLIRYEIGDVGTLTNRKCSCGSPMPLLESIEGRTYEMILDTKGNVVTPIYFRHLIGVVHNPGLFRRFQIVQKSAKQYELHLETTTIKENDSYQYVVKNIESDLRQVLGKDATIQIFRTKRIEESASGKFLYTRSEYTNNLNR